MPRPLFSFPFLIAARTADIDLATAARHYERALALEPANTRTLRNAGVLAGFLGQLDEGMAIGRFMISRDPVYPWGYWTLGVAQLFAGMLDEAIDSFATGQRLSPGFFGVQMYIGFALLFKGEPEAALEAIQ